MFIFSCFPLPCDWRIFPTAWRAQVPDGVAFAVLAFGLVGLVSFLIGLQTAYSSCGIAASILFEVSEVMTKYDTCPPLVEVSDVWRRCVVSAVIASGFSSAWPRLRSAMTARSYGGSRVHRDVRLLDVVRGVTSDIARYYTHALLSFAAVFDVCA